MSGERALPPEVYLTSTLLEEFDGEPNQEVIVYQNTSSNGVLHAADNDIVGRTVHGKLHEDESVGIEAYHLKQFDHPLLTYDQEQFFFRLGNPGERYKVSIEEVVHHEEFQNIVAVFHEDDKARFMEILSESSSLADLLVRMNTRLSIGQARKFNGRGDREWDHFQEGTFGLMKAVEKFDPDTPADKKNPEGKKVKFSTYAIWWVRQSIRRGIHDKARTIRLPVNVEASLSKARRLKDAIELDEERVMSPQELERLLVANNLSKEKAAMIASSLTGGGLTNVYSLDREIFSEEGATFADVIPDTGGNGESDTRLEDHIESVLQSLSSNEQYVLTHYYGLGGNTKETFSEIGKSLELSKARIGQIHQEALLALKSSPHNTTLYALFQGHEVL